MRTNYRKLWENYFNKKIPPGYEIHHIDGNFNNNDITNLQLVTMEEHLEIHRVQQDWGAVQAILMRMDNPHGISEVARKAQLERLKKGTHNFQLMSKERKREVSSAAGKKTLQQGTGVHKINKDPLLARENAKRAGLAAKLKCAGFLNTKSNKHGSKAVRGTVWWVNKFNDRKRSAECPGDGWVRGVKFRGNYES